MIGHGNEHAFSLRAALLAFFTALLLLAGCGGDDATSPSGSPAELAPAKGTVLYAEVQLDPGEERSKEIRETLRKVAKRDVLDLLVREVDKSIREEGVDVTYNDDIKPVLGKRAGVFLLGLKDEFDGAAIVDLEDTEAAQKLLDDNPGKDDKKADYKGNSYWTNAADDSAVGIVDGRFVGGSVAGYKAAVDTINGTKLSADARYKEAIEHLEGERLGHLYLDASGLIEAARNFLGTAGGALLDQTKRRLEQAGADATGIGVGFDLNASGFEIEYATSKAAAENLGVSTEASSLLEEMPAESWLALAGAGISEQVKKGFNLGFREGFEEGSGGLSLREFARQFEQITGVKPDSKLLESIDEVGVFAGGTQLLSLKAGIVAKSSDSEQLLANLKKIATGFGKTLGAPVRNLSDGGFEVAIPNAPVQIGAGRKDDKVALGLGEQGVKEALEPSKTLADDEDYKKAKEHLGEGYDPAFYALEGPILQLVQSLGQDLGPEFQMAKGYIEAFSHLIVGASQEDDAYRVKIALGVD